MRIEWDRGGSRKAKIEWYDFWTLPYHIPKGRLKFRLPIIHDIAAEVMVIYLIYIYMTSQSYLRDEVIDRPHNPTEDVIDTLQSYIHIYLWSRDIAAEVIVTGEVRYIYDLAILLAWRGHSQPDEVIDMRVDLTILLAIKTMKLWDIWPHDTTGY